MTIEDCSVHDFGYIGIFVEDKVTATIKANHVNVSNATTSVFGINLDAEGDKYPITMLSVRALSLAARV